VAPGLSDNPVLQRYEYRVGAALATVDYRRTPGLTTLTYARVPQALAGQGVGSAMARAVLEEVRARGERVVPVCGFIAAFIDRHPEFHSLLAGTG
jgi:predicted GNAT family acetyltransferase